MDSGWDVKHLLKLMVTVERLPAIVGRRQGAARARPGQRLAGPAEPLPPRRRGGARQRPGRQRPAVSEDRRAERQAVPAGRLLVVSEFPQARVGRTTRATNQYRRGLYTYWCRTFLHPSLVAFDAPTREECTVERPRSNTPLQALVLLERPDLRRGGPRLRRAHRARGRRRRRRRGSTGPSAAPLSREREAGGSATCCWRCTRSTGPNTPPTRTPPRSW